MIPISTEPKLLENCGFEGGDKESQKIDEGYFDKLGINAIWFTPIVEQIHDAVDEGTGLSFSRILGKRLDGFRP
jgi:glycosidase